MFETQGKLIAVLPEQTGTGKNGAWSKIDFVIETNEQYPKQICISAMNAKADPLKGASLGSIVKTSFNIESREYNGKYYTNLNAWKLEVEKGEAVASESAPEPPIEDLPF